MTVGPDRLLARLEPARYGMLFQTELNTSAANFSHIRPKMRL